MELLPVALGGTTGYIFRPAPNAEEKNKTQLSQSELEGKMAGDIFAKTEGMMRPSEWGLALPPDSTLQIAAPHQDKSNAYVSTIVIKNGFCALSIGIPEGFAHLGYFRI
jgi:hypothetical protein